MCDCRRSGDGGSKGDKRGVADGVAGNYPTGNTARNSYASVASVCSFTCRLVSGFAWVCGVEGDVERADSGCATNASCIANICDIGVVEMVTVISRDPSPPPAEYVKGSGGIFADMMIHDFDMARFLMGEEFVIVNALGAALVDKAIGEAGDVDTAAVQMQTASGKIAVITNSRRASYGYDQRMEVHGSLGMVHAKNVHNTTVEVQSKWGYKSDPIQNFFLERYMAAYTNELNSFITAVEIGNRDPKPNGYDGLQAQKLAEAAKISWQTGKPVKLA